MPFMNRLTAALAIFSVLFVTAACSGRADGGDAAPAEATAAGTGTPGATTVSEEKLPTGVSHATIAHDGLERTYRLFVPSKATRSEKLPLVVGLHGGLGSGDQFAGNSNFETLAESEGFIAVFPDGTNRTWNGGNCCGQAAAKDVDDVGFLAALIAHLTATLPVDSSRVFMTGHSNGGIMSFRFGCERSEMVRAIAPVAGSMEVPKCQPANGVSLFAIHGDADQSHPLEGGEGPRSIAGVPFVSMEMSLALWTAGMQCESSPERSTDGPLATTTWDRCRDGATASFIVIAGADHPWPGGNTRPGAQDRVSDDLDATVAIWTFFDRLR
jgi:polyhydroxybutyrate depolymerase